LQIITKQNLLKKATSVSMMGLYISLVNGKIEYKQDNKEAPFFHNLYKSVAGGVNGGR
jgi:hypothetical protein